MTQAPPEVVKIPAESPQLVQGKAAKPSGRARKAPAGRGQVLAVGNGRAATRGDGEVIELECGITLYPARSEGGRWRAVWHEDDQRHQCEAATEDKLTAKRMIPAFVTAGIDAGYLVNSRLAKVHWQAGDRLLPAPAVSVAGESAQCVDPR
jgi:hypothetical protein